MLHHNLMGSSHRLILGSLCTMLRFLGQFILVVSLSAYKISFIPLKRVALEPLRALCSDLMALIHEVFIPYLGTVLVMTCHVQKLRLILKLGVFSGRISESTPRGGVNRCKANLMTNDAELKINCNKLSVTKECSRIPSKGPWTNSSRFLLNKS